MRNEPATYPMARAIHRVLCGCAATGDTGEAWCDSSYPVAAIEAAAVARVGVLEAALREAVSVVSQGRQSQIGPSRVHTSQVNVETVERWHEALGGGASDQVGPLDALRRRCERLEGALLEVANEIEGDTEWTAERWLVAAGNALTHIYEAREALTVPQGNECDFCGRADGHSKRCSVTKFGVNPKPPYVPTPVSHVEEE